MTNNLTNMFGSLVNHSILATTTTKIGAALGIFVLIAIVLGIFLIVAMWKVFKKANQPGWAAIVPFYNTWVLFTVGGYPGWLGLLAALVIFIGGVTHSIAFIGITYVIYIVLTIMVAVRIAHRFGKGTAFAIFGLVLFPFVGYPILGFGKAQYEGGDSGTPTAPTPGSTQPMDNSSSNPPVIPSTPTSSSDMSDTQSVSSAAPVSMPPAASMNEPGPTAEVQPPPTPQVTPEAPASSTSPEQPPTTTPPPAAV